MDIGDHAGAGVENGTVHATGDDTREDTAPAVVLTASHSHLFPGARLACDEPVSPAAGGDVLVVFRDGATTSATLRPDGPGRAELDVSSWTTAAGTPVAGSRWRVTAGGAGGLPELVVGRRLPA